ncbi:hypothetical protein PFISCL1PPCAC_27819, partial [Pristionchus fissidentatus]
LYNAVESIEQMKPYNCSHLLPLTYAALNRVRQPASPQKAIFYKFARSFTQFMEVLNGLETSILEDNYLKQCNKRLTGHASLRVPRTTKLHMAHSLASDPVPTKRARLSPHQSVPVPSMPTYVSRAPDLVAPKPENVDGAVTTVPAEKETIIKDSVLPGAVAIKPEPLDDEMNAEDTKMMKEEMNETLQVWSEIEERLMSIKGHTNDQPSCSRDNIIKEENADELYEQGNMLEKEEDVGKDSSNYEIASVFDKKKETPFVWPPAEEVSLSLFIGRVTKKLMSVKISITKSTKTITVDEWIPGFQSAIEMLNNCGEYGNDCIPLLPITGKCCVHGYVIKPAYSRMKRDYFGDRFARWHAVGERAVTRSKRVSIENGKVLADKRGTMVLSEYSIEHSTVPLQKRVYAITDAEGNVQTNVLVIYQQKGDCTAIEVQSELVRWRKEDKNDNQPRDRNGFLLGFLPNSRELAEFVKDKPIGNMPFHNKYRFFIVTSDVTRIVGAARTGVCVSCSYPIHLGATRGSVDDLHIRHAEKFCWTNKKGVREWSKDKTRIVLIHARYDCIVGRYPYASPRFFKVFDECAKTLTVVHKEWIRSSFAFEC